jgi:hypothetical protein
LNGEAELVYFAVIFSCIEKRFMVDSNVMSKYLGIIIGVVALLLGFRGLTVYWGDLLTVLKGFLPAVLILGGAISVIAGISEIKDEISSRREDKG